MAKPVRRIETYSLPSYWASYLINGDATGLNDADIEKCDEATQGLGSCVSVGDDQWFGQYAGLGCDLSEYSFIIETYPKTK